MEGESSQWRARPEKGQKERKGGGVHWEEGVVGPMVLDFEAIVTSRRTM